MKHHGETGILSVSPFYSVFYLQFSEIQNSLSDHKYNRQSMQILFFKSVLFNRPVVQIENIGVSQREPSFW